MSDMLQQSLLAPCLCGSTLIEISKSFCIGEDAPPLHRVRCIKCCRQVSSLVSEGNAIYHWNRENK